MIDFKDRRTRKDIFGIVIFIIITILFFAVIFALIPEFDYCIEDGDCPEGYKMYDNGKEITITKSYCINNHYQWDEKARYCYMRETINTQDKNKKDLE